MKVLIVFGLIWSSIALGGDERGNGGDGIRCPMAGGKYKVELLDHYEARTIRKIKINLGDDALSAEEKVKLAISRIFQINPIRAKKYLGWLESFKEDAFFVSEGELQDIPDAGAVVIPSGCELVQLAVYQEKTLPGDHTYLVNLKYWNELDNDGKAGLMLHEFIYRDFTSQVMAHSNSKMARYFNALISSIDLNEYTLQSYLDLLQKLKVYSAEAQYGAPISLFNCKTECLPVKPTYFNENKIAKAGRDTRTRFEYKFWNSDMLALADRADFNEDGWLKNFMASEKLTIKFDDRHQAEWAQPEGDRIYSARIAYYENQYIVVDTYWAKNNIELTVDGVKEYCPRVRYNIKKKQGQCI